MKKTFKIILGIWNAITCFISPIWLTMAFLNITGLIYKYDYSMDDGTAIIIGIFLLVMWLILALLPNVVLLKQMSRINKKYFVGNIVSIILLCVACVAMCNWNIVEFLTVP